MTERQIFIKAPRDRKGRLAWLKIPPKTMIKTLENDRIKGHEKAPTSAVTPWERDRLLRSRYERSYLLN